MKKIFTFAAAILASVSLMAAEPTFESYDWDSQATAEAVLGVHEGITINGAFGSAGNVSGHWYLPINGNLKCTDETWGGYMSFAAAQKIDSIAIFYCPNGSNQTTIAWAAWGQGVTPAKDVLGHGVTTGTKSSKSWDNAVWETIDLSAIDAYTVYISRSIREFYEDDAKLSNFGGGQTINVLGVRVWISNATPSTDPVTSVNISGPTAGYVGQTVTFTATTDAKADTLFWTVDGAVQESHTKTLTLALDGARTYQVACWARNQYNTAEDWAVGNLSIVATVKPVLEQVVVTDHTTWDFSKAATVSQIKWENELKDATPVVMANIDGMNNDANFNSQALLFSGEYPIRDGKYCQGAHLSFQINSPGLLTIEYSNTGNRSAADGETEGQEALRRFLTINGNLVAGDAGSMKSNANTTTSGIAVVPGNVVISAVMPYSEDPTTAQYIRIYKVVYQRTGWPTAIENTENEVKAVKRIVNGVMVIEKNGVVYNAQGQIVK